MVPNYDVEVTRNDNIASSGKAEHIYERTDTFLEFDMQTVVDADAAAWQAFLNWANQGNVFDYYPDASLGTFTTYTIENKNLKLAWRSPGIWQLPGLKFRTVV